MSEGATFCRMCGKCCHFEIPITLLDIHRMAGYLSVKDEKAFKEYIQDEASPRSYLFMIRKAGDGACIFLSPDNKCTIHDAKPSGCSFYLCSRDSVKVGDDVLPWTATCTDPSTRSHLWEQSIAAMLTKAYVSNNGARWNGTDYNEAILSIYDNIIVSDTQKIKLTRSEDGAPMAMIYDCSRCDMQGLCVRETPVTLDDIRRIKAYLGLSWKSFFRQKIDKEPSASTSGLKFKRNGHCVFFGGQQTCTVEEVRPMHCRFTPCPRKTMNDEMMDCLFLGSGTVEEQFRHQVSLSATRQYVAECGTGYDKQGIDKAMKTIDHLVRKHTGFSDFCRRIAHYRYVDDALLVLRQHEADYNDASLGN